ncbi:ribosome-inactivating family protein [Streptomyces sp. NPDC097727]|uniref:ribosome-inactivating family protein n=1 Tax=Streptomyces sp. NPDC097727 TaxID=3366092 RepID=UPI0038063329
MSTLMTSTGFRIRTAVGTLALALAAALLHAPVATAAGNRPAAAAAQAADDEQPDITQPADFALAYGKLIYQIRQTMTEPAPVGPRGFTHMVLGRGNNGTRNWGRIGVGHLTHDHDADALQLIFDPDDLYIQGFYRRSDHTLFRFPDAPIPAELVDQPDRTLTTQEFGFAVNYDDLPGTNINQAAVTGAIANLMTRDDIGKGGPLQNAMQIMAVTFAETARNQLINFEVYRALRGGGTWQVGAHAPAMTSWDQMGEDIRNAVNDRDWERDRRSYRLDGQHGGQLTAYSAASLMGIIFVIKRR